MNREDEIRQTNEMYNIFLDEISSHISSLEAQKMTYQKYKGLFAKTVVLKLSLKIRYHKSQFQQMQTDKARALSRIRLYHDRCMQAHSKTQKGKTIR